MIQPFKKDEQPDLGGFPSAMAQEPSDVQRGASVAGPRRRWLRFCAKVAVRLTVVAVILAVIGTGVLFFALSRGPISHEQLRAQIESQLTAFLGQNFQARLRDVELALGQNGLLSLDGEGLLIEGADGTNMAVANNVGVKLDPVALLGGKVRVSKITSSGGSVSLLPQLEKMRDEDKPSVWPGHFDFAQALERLGKGVAGFSTAIAKAGLDEVDLIDTKLVGFEALGFRSSTGKASHLSLRRDANYQEGLFFGAAIRTEFENLNLNGSWRPNGEAGHILTMSIEGMNLRELLQKQGAEPSPTVELGSPATVFLAVPYDAEGQAGRAEIRVLLDRGKFVLGRGTNSQLVKADLNFTVDPVENQVILTPSPVHFPDVRTNLSMRFDVPKNAEAPSAGEIQFEILADKLISFASVPSGQAAEGQFLAKGRIDAPNRSVELPELSLSTQTGTLSGKAAAQFSEGSPALQFELGLPEMAVDQFKQIWPLFLAPKVREWAEAGIEGGTITNSWVKGDFHAGLLSRREPFRTDQLNAEINISNAKVKTTGELPPLINANGQILYSGMETDIVISDGQSIVEEGEVVDVTGGRMEIGNFHIRPLGAQLTLNLTGSSRAFALIGDRKPLAFSKVINLRPEAVKGKVDALVKTDLTFLPERKIKAENWTADLTIANGSSSDPLAGRKISDANVTVEATPEEAKISGTANIDGVKADIAMVQPLGKGASSQQSVSMELDEKARKKMGIKTGDIISGPVTVSIGSGATGTSSVTADLKNARISFPWIGWSKGKGIGGTATFNMATAKGVTKITKLVLNGDGFSAQGDLTVDKNGLRSANFRRVRLNKTDDFDVAIRRIKGGFSVDIDARSYDGRALVRSILDSKQGEVDGNTVVVVKGKVKRLLGFNQQTLTGVQLDFSQRGSQVRGAQIRAVADGGAPTRLAMERVDQGLRTTIYTENAGSLLGFFDLYSKMRGGLLDARIVQTKGNIATGVINAANFQLLNEPRLATLLSKPDTSEVRIDKNQVVQALNRVKPQNARVDNLVATIEKGPDYFKIRKGRLSGGDASAVFQGDVYDARRRMNIRGTFLPGRALNSLVSKIPIIGKAFANNKTRGVLGITFRLVGPFSNPQIRVNPLSIIAPGVFRKLFDF
ncbi:MAG: DUF3971 domain-containing protein [Pseudomonadota bacterium]